MAERCRVDRFREGLPRNFHSSKTPTVEAKKLETQ